jgi:translocation and assembly module TamB
MKWKRISFWTGAAIIALATGVFAIAAVLVKQSPSFRQGVLAKAEGRIYEATGARVAVRDFNLDFFPISLDLYGVVVHGSEPQFGEPLLQADRVTAEIEMRTLRGRTWSLRELVIHHPVAHLFVSQAGESNLPQPEKPVASKARIFGLSVRELRLRSAEIDCNGQRFKLEGEFDDLHANADYDAGAQRYRGLLNYREARVRYGDSAPVTHSLDLSFDATATKFVVNRLVLASGKSRIAGTGRVEDYNNPAVQATYDGQVLTSDAAPFFRNAGLPDGVVHVAGSLNYRRDPSRGPLDSVALNGTISSPALAVSGPGLRVGLNDFGARYRLAAGKAEIENIHAQVFAGKMTGTLSLHDLDGASNARLVARLKDASLEEVQAAERKSVRPQARLSGRVSADIEATWNRAPWELAAHGNVTLAGTLGQTPAVPLHGTIRADYSSARQQLSLRQSYIRTAQTSITLDGSVSEQSQLQISLRSGNLHEVELLAENFRLAPALDLYGAGSFTGSVSGPAGTPRLKGQLEASDLRVRGTRWKLLRTDIDASPSSLSFSNGSLEAASRAPEKLQPPGPGATTTARSEGLPPSDVATVK